MTHHNRHNSRSEFDLDAAAFTSDADHEVLKEAAAALRRARFESPATAGVYETQLRKRLLERRAEQTRPWRDRFVSRIRAAARPRFAPMVAAFVIIVIGSLLLSASLQRPTHVAHLFIDPVYAEDNFEVSPTLGDTLAVESNTHFIIKSKTPVNEEELRAHITLAPETLFRIEKITDQEYRVIPEAALAPRTVYQLTIAASYQAPNGATVEREYSWAFQVKDTLKIMRTIPGDETTDVPTNTGIEITFSTEAVSGYEAAIHFEPSAKGRFEKRGRTVVFVPEALQPGTLYTVTVSPTIAVEGAHPMTETHQFQFETSSETVDTETSWAVDRRSPIAEFSTVQSPAVPVWVRPESSPSFSVEVYAFPAHEAFLEAANRHAEYPAWAHASRIKQTVPTDTLASVRQYTLSPQSAGLRDYLVLPDTLPSGFYLLAIREGERTEQMFVIISDLATFVSVTKTKTLVWVNNMKTAAAEAGVTVSNLSKTATQKTDARGLAVFDTAALFPATASDKEQRYLELSSGPETLYVPIYNGSDSAWWEQRDWRGEGKLAHPAYWHYISLDRPIYLPTDTVNIWGFIQPRAGGTNEKAVTVRLETGGEWYMPEPRSTLAEKTLTLDAQGFFTGALELSRLTPGNYLVSFFVAGELLETKYIQIESYTKPAYALSVLTDKQAVFAGDTVAFRTDAAFFEGTPVVGLELKYTALAHEEQTFTTNAEGAATAVTSAPHAPCALEQDDCYTGEQHEIITVAPVRAEEGEVQGQAHVRVFPTRVDADVALARQGGRVTVSSTAYALDLAPLNNDDDADDAAYRIARAANRTVTGLVKEINHVKRETGQYYDFISKVTRKTYTYDRIETVIARFTGVTDASGRFTHSFPGAPDKDYQVRLLIDDGAGKAARNDQYISGSRAFHDLGEGVYYTLRDRKEPGKGYYHLGETVTVDLYANNARAAVDGPVLFYELHDGLDNYRVSREPSYTFRFREAHLPSVTIGSVYFDGSGYRLIERWVRPSIRFNTESRALTIDIHADKAEYRPGESMHLAVSVRGPNGAPKAATLNLKLIDEAYYALGPQTDEPLADLYRDMPTGELATYVTHQYVRLDETAAGGFGACFLAGTKIRMADGTTKNIEDIRPGDEVRTFESEQSGRRVSGRVAAVQEHVVSAYLVINDMLRVTPEHRIWASGRWMTAGDLKPGDRLRTEENAWVEVQTVRRVEETVPVYNFHVEPYHTYIADGIYVHNEKGGGPGRSFFPDVALFTAVKTDAAGRAELTVKLPDSITSWRLTAQGITPRYDAGIAKKKISVSLPFFAHTSLPDELLAGDQPVMQIRTNGRNLRDSDPVSGTVEAVLFPEGHATVHGAAFKTMSIPFPPLSEGMFPVTTTVKTGKEHDKLLDTVHVVPSRITRRIHTVVRATPEAAVPGNPNGLTKLLITDLGRASLYDHIMSLACDCGGRIDQRIGNLLAQDLLKTVFGQGEGGEPFDTTIYQDEAGGIKLLPYSSPDLETSAAMAAVAGDYFRTSRLIGYFYGHLADNRQVNREEVALSLYGLAALGEPVLPSLRRFAALDLAPKEQIYAAHAFAALGDRESARDLYRTLVTAHGRKEDSMSYINLGAKDEERVWYTAQMAALGARIGDPLAPLFMDYARHGSSKAADKGEERLTISEMLLSIRHTLPRLTATPAELTIHSGDREEKIVLKPGEARVFTIAPQDLPSLRFSGILGSVGIVSEYDVPLMHEKDRGFSDLSLRRTYLVDGKETTTVREGDMVEIRLEPTYGRRAPRGNYQIIDVLPSGLRALTHRYVYNQNTPCANTQPFEADGQKMIFFADNSQNSYRPCSGYVSYYARVVTPGTYKLEPAVLQSAELPELFTYSSPQGTMTIAP